MRILEIDENSDIIHMLEMTVKSLGHKFGYA